MWLWLLSGAVSCRPVRFTQGLGGVCSKLSALDWSTTLRSSTSQALSHPPLLSPVGTNCNKPTKNFPCTLAYWHTVKLRNNCLNCTAVSYRLSSWMSSAKVVFIFRNSWARDQRVQHHGPSCQGVRRTRQVSEYYGSIHRTQSWLRIQIAICLPRTLKYIPLWKTFRIRIQNTNKRIRIKFRGRIWGNYDLGV
mgnify:CR=1 FL=1